MSIICKAAASKHDFIILFFLLWFNKVEAAQTDVSVWL